MHLPGLPARLPSLSFPTPCLPPALSHTFSPLMVAAGNHEIEWLSNATSVESQIFMSYEKRFRMPQVAPAVITNAPDPLSFDAGQKLCAPTQYQAGYEWGNSYFSYVTGPVLFVHLNPYSYTNSSSTQYGWLLKTLKGVNRNVTPWVVVSACVYAIHSFC